MHLDGEPKRLEGNVMGDRRKRKRFKVKDNVFAVFHSDLIKVASLIDLSMDGLAFEEQLDGETGLVGSIYGLDIFCADDDCSEEQSVQNIPFNIVSEADIIVPDTSNETSMRRCSVKFDRLSYLQQAHLEFFLNRHIIHEA